MPRPDSAPGPVDPHRLDSVNAQRRRLLQAGAIGAMTFTVAGCKQVMTPGEAHAAGADFNALPDAAVATLDRLGDILLPGARERGFTHFIDSQSTGAAAEFLGLLRYMDWPPPYAAFYIDGAAALDALSRARHAAAFHALDDDDATALIASIAAAQPADWSGPPAPLYYFVTRSDAVDVYYGTMDGFAALNVPYVAHIPPPEPW